LDFLKDFTEEFYNIWHNTERQLDQELGSIASTLKTDCFPITNKTYEKYKKKWGVYIFTISPKNSLSLEELSELWDETGNGYVKYPQVCKTRFYNSTINAQKSYVLYVGKSEDIGKRIKEHIIQEKSKTTYGLKLIGRKILEESSIAYNSWLLPESIQVHESKPIKQFLITQLESKLRNNLNPWIGKQ